MAPTVTGSLHQSEVRLDQGMDVKKLNIDCDEGQLNTAIDAAKNAINRTDSNQERASYVRKIMDDRYGPAWSCISGRDFGRTDVKRLRIEIDHSKLQTAIDAASEALRRTKSNQERATIVRQAMDNRYGPAWSCVTGMDFGSEIPYLPENFAFFTVNSVSFLVCKSTENVKIV
ncbi:hypothetical protein ACTXT7_011877 [Hymenolepis weldensis]